MSVLGSHPSLSTGLSSHRRKFGKLILPFILISLFSLINCKNYPKSGSAFWKDFYTFHDELRQSSFLGGEYNIIFKSLSPEKEAVLNKIPPNTLYLSGRVKKTNTGRVAEFSDLKEASEEDLLFAKTSYQLSNRKGKETYKIIRETKYSLPPLYASDILQWLAVFLENPESLNLDASSFYKYFCTYYECKRSSKNNLWSLKFHPGIKLNSLDPVHYNRTMKSLENTRFHIDVSNKENGKFLEIRSDNKDFIIEFVQGKKINPTGRFDLNIVFHIEYFGLKIDIKNLKYSLTHKQSKTEETLQGQYIGQPSLVISGNLWHILPPFLIDAFIPGNMEEYLNDYFDMLQNGNNGKGNYFEIKYTRGREGMTMNVINSSEVYRKPFKFLSSPPKKEESASKFMHGLEERVITDTANTD